jgi:anti-anti-sigma factor
METGVTLHGDVARVLVKGRIVDGKPADELKATLKRLHREGRTKTIIDLTEVTWFDSLAIGILIAHYTSAVNRGGEVVLVGANEKIRSLMQMVRLADRFLWYPTLEQALGETR